MFENGAIYKTPDEKTPKGKIIEGKTIILLHLHGDVFCLLEIVNGKPSVVRAEKWEYSASELPARLEGFEFVESAHLSVAIPARVVKVEPKPEAKVTKESRRR